MSTSKNKKSRIITIIYQKQEMIIWHNKDKKKNSGGDKKTV